MAPHAGYMASGPNAASAFRAIREDSCHDAYVIIGPDHHGMCPGSVMCSESYLTPLGEAKVHEGICRKLSEHIMDAPELHAYEHSIEVEVPFIQYIDPDARIVPIIMGDQSFQEAERLATALKEACEGVDALFIASTDMSHYISRNEASRLDGLVLGRIKEMDRAGMYRTVSSNGITMCGYGPTATVMGLCDGCKPERMLHTDSSDTGCSDPGSVVGYGSCVFAKK